MIVEDKTLGEFKYNIQHNSESHKMKINSLCVALFLSIQLFNHFLNINTVVTTGIILIISIINNRRLYFNIKALMFFLFIIFWFGVTKVFFSFETSTLIYFIFFLAYGGTALYLCNKEYIAKNIIFYLCIIHTLVSPFVLVSAINKGATMGEVYSFIGGVFALILCVFTSRFRVSSVYTMVFLVTLLIYFYKLSLVNTRGAYLSLLVFMVLYYVVSMSNVTWKTFLFMGMVFALLFTFYMYFYEILVLIEVGLNEFNIRINVISKSIYLLENNRFDHNRNWFYLYAIEGIKEHWLVGQGIGSFENQTGRVYIHNVILQILFEGGIIYFLPFIIILFKILKWILPVNNIMKNEQVFIILLMSSSLVKLMFSETYLKEQKFLLLLMILLARKRR